jgi:hypothetical protein
LWLARRDHPGREPARGGRTYRREPGEPSPPGTALRRSLLLYFECGINSNGAPPSQTDPQAGRAP